MKPMQTGADLMKVAHKSLVFGFPGAGKTYQAKHMQAHYGPGFVISGEGGLRSVGDATIDYLPFQSYDGESDHARGIYTFKEILAWVRSEEFRSRGYRWIMLDSLTELGDRVMEVVEKRHAGGGKQNGFAIWGDYKAAMLGILKIIRDLPVHVVVTSLAKEETDENGVTTYWPLVPGSAVAKQLPGLFDHVFGLVRATDGGKDAPIVRRFIVTDHVRGWVCKTRDPYSRVPAYMETSDITKILDLVSSPPEAK